MTVRRWTWTLGLIAGAACARSPESRPVLESAPADSARVVEASVGTDAGGKAEAAQTDGDADAALADGSGDGGVAAVEGGSDASRAAQPTLLYREYFTGVLPYRAKLRTHALLLSEDGRFVWTDEQAEADENSLVKEKPLANLRVVSTAVYAGTWSHPRKGALTLVFEGDAGAPVQCAEGTVQALEPGAALRLTPAPGGETNRARWSPGSRRRVHVWHCERAWLADASFLWSDEPQPERLPMADFPGVEYAHDNSDMVVQKGGIRRLRR